jgi:DGQHR domain-containing protein
MRLPALRVEQGTARTLFCFAVDGKIIPSFAAVSRVRRTDGELGGYQRPEVLSHIAEIKEYLEGPKPLIPNAIVLTFDRRVRFLPDTGRKHVPGVSTTGTLIIPVDPDWTDKEKPGFVVDGQQRLAAIRDARCKSFPVCVTAFVSDDVREHAEQFILVNSTKPLPKGLIYELLPRTSGKLPAALTRKRFPSYLVERLNLDEDSPLRGAIQTPTTPEGTMKDSAFLRMLENSLTDGILYHFRGAKNEFHAMIQLLKNFWGAVAVTFSKDWQAGGKSRITHGASIIALGILMDEISDAYDASKPPSQKVFERELSRVRSLCCWSSGTWKVGTQRRKWNDVQNTPKDIQFLSDALRAAYAAGRK